MIFSTIALTTSVLGVHQTDTDLAVWAKTALDATGLNYGKTESGKNYTIYFDHPDNRHQMVYMSTKPSTPGGQIMISFYTTFWISKEAPTDEMLLNLMATCKKFGSVYTYKGTNGVWSIRFQVKFNASGLKADLKSDSLLVKHLKDTIYYINAVGEELDKSVNGSKDISN